MMSEPRIDTASLLIKASPQKIYHALITQSAIRQWKAPEGMHMEIFHFNSRINGTYKLALRYDDRKKKGKSEGHSDLINGRFLELVPGKKIVETIQFESANPLFAGEMTMTTELSTQKNGTLITLTAENVPAGITPEDHAIGMQSSLTNLERYLT